MQGLNYNDRLDEREKQAALGWRVEITRAERLRQEGIIELRVHGAAGRPLGGLFIDGVLKRPAHKDRDAALVFTQTGDGVYRATLNNLAAGAWDLSASAVNETGDRLEFAGRIVIE